MTTLETSASVGLRLLDDHELGFVNGGIIDGCIKLPGIIPFHPPPPHTPRFDPL